MTCLAYSTLVTISLAFSTPARGERAVVLVMDEWQKAGRKRDALMLAMGEGDKLMMEDTMLSAAEKAVELAS